VIRIKRWKNVSVYFPFPGIVIGSISISVSISTNSAPIQLLLSEDSHHVLPLTSIRFAVYQTRWLWEHPDTLDVLRILYYWHEQQVAAASNSRSSLSGELWAMLSSVGWSSSIRWERRLPVFCRIYSYIHLFIISDKTKRSERRK